MNTLSVDIVEVAERLDLGLTRTKHQLQGPCPQCGGHNRFWINRRRQCFKCRKCKEGGKAIGLVMLVKSCSSKEAVEWLKSLDPLQDASTRAVRAEPKQQDVIDAEYE